MAAGGIGGGGGGGGDQVGRTEKDTIDLCVVLESEIRQTAANGLACVMVCVNKAQIQRHYVRDGGVKWKEWVSGGEGERGAGMLSEGGSVVLTITPCSS